MRFSPILFYFFFLLLMGLNSSCNDMQDVPTPTTLPDTKGETGVMYILSEGLYTMNNSNLMLLDFQKMSISTDFFTLVNGRGLGDTSNDMQLYGAKLWLVVNVSSQVEVLDVRTGLSLKRIPFFDDNVARQPRFIAFYQNKAYVCSFDGSVACIDTTTMSIEKSVQCGANPDGIAVANGKLYVSNSGGLNAPNYGTSLSVIDLADFSLKPEISVGLNPYKIHVDSQGDVYVVVRGDAGSSDSKLVKIDSQTDEVSAVFDSIHLLDFIIRNDTAYMYSVDYVDNSYKVKTFDCISEQIISDQFITDGTFLQRPFGIFTHPTNGNVYITDAKNYTVKGDLFCFSRQGQLQYKIESVGLNPNAVVVVP